MKVKFMTRSAGPSGTIMPGEVVDVPEREAMLLVKGRFAEPVNAGPPVESAQLADDTPQVNAGTPAQQKTGKRARKG